MKLILFFFIPFSVVFGQNFSGGGYVGIGLVNTNVLNINTTLTSNGLKTLNPSFMNAVYGINGYFGRVGFFSDYTIGLNGSGSGSMNMFQSFKVGPSARFTFSDKISLGTDLYYTYSSIGYQINTSQQTQVSSDSLNKASSGNIFLNTSSHGFGINLRMIYKNRFELKLGYCLALSSSDWKTRNVIVQGLPNEKIQLIQLGVNYHFKQFKGKKQESK
jgi:hypothetical protein